MISMIASVGKNMELGKDNKLLWHISEDMKFFKKMTMGHVVVMGKNTYYSLPSKGLPGREMIVISSGQIDGNVKVIHSIDDIIDKYKNSNEEIFIIGGASIYRQFLEYADFVYLTEVNKECKDADVYFPIIDKNKWIKKILYKDIDNEYVISKYIRR